MNNLTRQDKLTFLQNYMAHADKMLDYDWLNNFCKKHEPQEPIVKDSSDFWFLAGLLFIGCIPISLIFALPSIACLCIASFQVDKRTKQVQESCQNKIYPQQFAQNEAGNEEVTIQAHALINFAVFSGKNDEMMNLAQKQINLDALAQKLSDEQFIKHCNPKDLAILEQIYIDKLYQFNQELFDIIEPVLNQLILEQIGNENYKYMPENVQQKLVNKQAHELITMMK